MILMFILVECSCDNNQTCLYCFHVNLFFEYVMGKMLKMIVWLGMNKQTAQANQPVVVQVDLSPLMFVAARRTHFVIPPPTPRCKTWLHHF